MTDPEVSKLLLPEPFTGTGDITAYITQFELLSTLQNWLKPLSDSSGNQRRDTSGNLLFSDKRHTIFPLRLRNSAIEFYQSLDTATKGDYDKLKAAFENQYLEPAEFFRGALRKRVQGETEKVSEFLSDLWLLARKAYPTDSEDIRNHLVLQAFMEGSFNPQVRIELRKAKPDTIKIALEKAIHLAAIYRLEASQAVAGPSSSTTTFNVNSVDELVSHMETLVQHYNVGQVSSDRNKNRWRSPDRRQRSPYRSRNGRKSDFRQSPRRSPGQSPFRRSSSRSPGRSQSRSPSSEKRVRFNGDMVCYSCNRKGHSRKDCRNCWNCGSSQHSRSSCPKASPK